MKKNIIILSIVVGITAIFLIFGSKIQVVFQTLIGKYNKDTEFLVGSTAYEKGKLSIKIRIDNSHAIKEVYVIEHPDNEIAISAIQKLIANSMDKQSAKEIDTVSGATMISNAYKSVIESLLDEPVDEEQINDTTKISLTDEEVAANIERQINSIDGYKSGIGGYVFNQFTDADYNKNGNLVTNEYICAVLLNPNNRIEDVRFDHIESNISFDKYGQVPTGNAKVYNFISDRAKTGFNGLINDGNYADMFEFERAVLTYRHFEDIKNRYINKKGYAPLVYALENAIDNARAVGASQGDTLGLSVIKILEKKNIRNATDTENGKVSFYSNYCMLTVDKDKIITSAMFDNVENTATLTNVGKILGSREKEIYTLNELSNTTKYSKIEVGKYVLKTELNLFADYLKGNSIDVILNVIAQITDAKGNARAGTSFESMKNIDFINYIDIISKAFADSIRIRPNI